MFTGTVDSLLDLERPDNMEVKFFRGVGWAPARRHNSACEKALNWGADLILILGADQIYEPDLLKRLVARFQEGHEVVAAMVPCRGWVNFQPMRPFQKMAWRFKYNSELGHNNMTRYRNMALDGDLVHMIDPKDGDVQHINFIGSGVLMFHRDHLLMLSRPWFKETIEADGPTSGFQRIANQDCVFVWRLQREAHARCYVDTTIQVKHLHIFEIDETFSERFSDWAVDATELYKQSHPETAVRE